MSVSEAPRSRIEAAIEAFIGEQKPEHQKIIQELRSLIKKAVAGLHEDLKGGNPCYVMGGKEGVCCIYTISDPVNLGFFRGAEIIDSALPLEETGKGMRHVKIDSVEKIDAKKLERLIQQAVALGKTGRGRATRKRRA